MEMLRISKQVIAALCFVCCVSAIASSQTKRRTYSLVKFDNHGCEAKGRVQDCQGPVMQQILADGKKAIPILIAQLTETQRAKKDVGDYWYGTTSGDIAFVVLNDLFTEPDYKTFNMRNVPNWTMVSKDCDSTAQGCWEAYLRHHGRLSVQKAWQAEWNVVKERMYWDSQTKCFRVLAK